METRRAAGLFPGPYALSRRAVPGAVLAALATVFWAYGPALAGPFVFDDYALPFRFPGFQVESFHSWISGVRPLLMLSYWVNYQISGAATGSYHLVNVLIHWINSLLAGAILWKLLGARGVRSAGAIWLAGFGAAIFLLHPVQSESVAYIAGRSESLSAMFLLGALAVFLFRSAPAISWATAAAICALFAAAAATKEHAVALVGVLLVTDLYLGSWRKLKGNWRLYVSLAVAAVFAVAAAFQVLLHATSAGFSVRGLPWHHYFFTQMRVWLYYVRLFFFPSGLTVDHDFSVSTTVLEGGAAVALVVWIVVLAAAVVFRRRYPLAGYGVLVFLIFLAPTSSFIPIKDLAAERRMYLALIGLVLIVLEAASRIRRNRAGAVAACAVFVAALGLATHARSKVWSDAVRLWESAIATTPAKARPYGNLAAVYLARQECAQASQVVDRAVKALRRVEDAQLLTVWGLTLECVGQYAPALEKIEEAARREPSAQISAVRGRLYTRAGRFAEALRAFAEAEQMDPRWEMTYVYRGRTLVQQGDYRAAETECRRALSINPNNMYAKRLLEQVVRRTAL